MKNKQKILMKESIYHNLKNTIKNIILHFYILYIKF